MCGGWLAACRIIRVGAPGDGSEHENDEKIMVGSVVFCAVWMRPLPYF